MSAHIPSERQEAEVLANYELVQAQLSLRHNPYGLVVDPELSFPPPPFMDGQWFLEARYSHLNGRQEGAREWIAVNGQWLLKRLR